MSETQVSCEIAWGILKGLYIQISSKSMNEFLLSNYHYNQKRPAMAAASGSPTSPTSSPCKTTMRYKTRNLCHSTIQYVSLESLECTQNVDKIFWLQAQLRLLRIQMLSDWLHSSWHAHSYVHHGGGCMSAQAGQWTQAPSTKNSPRQGGYIRWRAFTILLHA